MCLIEIVESSHSRKAVTELLRRDFVTFDERASVWGMQLNLRKTKQMVVSRPSTVATQFPVLNFNGAVLAEYPHLNNLGVIFYVCILTF